MRYSPARDVSGCRYRTAVRGICDSTGSLTWLLRFCLNRRMLEMRESIKIVLVIARAQVNATPFGPNEVKRALTTDCNKSGSCCNAGLIPSPYKVVFELEGSSICVPVDVMPSADFEAAFSCEIRFRVRAIVRKVTRTYRKTCLKSVGKTSSR